MIVVKRPHEDNETVENAKYTKQNVDEQKGDLEGVVAEDEAIVKKDKRETINEGKTAEKEGEGDRATRYKLVNNSNDDNPNNINDNTDNYNTDNNKDNNNNATNTFNNYPNNNSQHTYNYNTVPYVFNNKDQLVIASNGINNKNTDNTNNITTTTNSNFNNHAASQTGNVDAVIECYFCNIRDEKIAQGLKNTVCPPPPFDFSCSFLF